MFGDTCLSMNRPAERITCCSQVLRAWAREVTGRQGIPSHPRGFEAASRYLHPQHFFPLLELHNKITRLGDDKEDKRIAWGICAKIMDFEELKKRHKLDPGHVDIQDGVPEFLDILMSTTDGEPLSDDVIMSMVVLVKNLLINFNFQLFWATAFQYHLVQLHSSRIKAVFIDT